MEVLTSGIKDINDEALLAELTAALGPVADGWARRDNELYLILDDAATPEQVQAALAVYDAHDNHVLTTAQNTASRRFNATEELRGKNFKGVLQNINALTIPAGAKDVLKEMLLLQYQTALAAGIIDTPDPTT